MATTNRAYGYLRVSTDGQAESGLGLDAQRSAITTAAARHGLNLGDVFTDAGVSGALELEDRPGLFAAVNALKRGDVLLVAKRDRLGRDVVAVAMLERLVARKGARILSAAGEGTEGTDAASMLQRRILDAFGEYERLIIGTAHEGGTQGEARQRRTRRKHTLRLLAQRRWAHPRRQRRRAARDRAAPNAVAVIGFGPSGNTSKPSFSG